MTVEEMKAVDIRTVHPEELVDITKLSIDKSLEGDDRKAEFIRQVKNPYCYRVYHCKIKLFRWRNPYGTFSGISPRGVNMIILS